MQSMLHPLVAPVITLVLLILLITRVKLHPFLALILASAFLGVSAGLAPTAVIRTFEKGFGSILSSVGLVVGLGTMLGGLLLESGGADRIANTFIGLGSKRWIPAAICAASLLIGLPHLFDVSFVMLVPLVYAIANRTRSPLLAIGIPMAAGLYVSHGLLPPHPSPTLALAALHADAGRTIFYGLVIAVPMAILSGPVFTAFAMRFLPVTPGEGMFNPGAAAADVSREARPVPPFGLVLATVLLPPVLMMIRTFGRGFAPTGTFAREMLETVGDPIVSLLIAVLFAIWSLGVRSGLSLAQIQKLLGESVAPGAVVILILGAGGGLKEMLLATHVGDAIAHGAAQWSVSPLLLGWGVAALIRIAIGSATVATATAAGNVAPIAAATPGVNLELLVLAVSSGGLMLSHLNDSGFWLFKEYFRLSVGDTLKTWTLLVSFQSLLALAMIMLLNAVVG
ncbi:MULTISPECIES: GntT/GntP/DsdX family permease [Burkholderiaceae]|uniref:Gluconate transporter family protein n=1 Tax=Caballeronia sordidicola TaxID=196367 RepID=A0A242N3H9_CABSO|nr:MULTISPECIES: gluconate:H+ symporter [Burkholderiaceae]AMH43834.1 permease DsdX [Burkholderia sp. PAMC 26561]OTP78225.1 Gluconate transporter family protein [Caballeronia sordidicola]